MQDKNIVKIRVDLTISQDDARHFKFLYDLYEKQGKTHDIQEFVNMIFLTGFSFVRGQFVGSIVSDINKNILNDFNKKG